MKIYATADIHGAQHRLNEAVEVIEHNHPDITVVAGDITQFGPGDMATLLLDQLPGNVLSLPGNIDTADVWEGIKKSHAINMHKNQINVQGMSFAGINGVDDGETELILTDEQLKQSFEGVDVLITHVPPYGFQDTVFLGKHAGSKAVQRIVKSFHPRLVISGHIHERPGYTADEQSLVVNCSMGKRGRGALITLNDSITVKMLD